MAEHCFKCGNDTTLADNGMLYCRLCKEYRLPKDPRIESKLSFANDLRLRAEFDRAAYEYEGILRGNSKNVKAHWGLFLSRYGILYEKDPATLKMIPTINRLTRTSVRDDPNFKYAVENMQPISLQMQYGYDGKYINDVLSESLKKVANEKPYDVFICYKSEDTNLAYDLYNELKNKGFKVFFAKSSIQAGKYEPQIFSALVTAKVMIVLATKRDYLESVWVKNEWSRFNRMVKDDPASKVIINAYKSDKPVDLPPELSAYQAFNMNDLDFLDRVINEIKKRVKPESIPNPISNHDVFIERGYLALGDKNFSAASDFFDKALNADPHSPKAYLGMLLVELNAVKIEQIATAGKYLNEYHNYEKAFKFADSQTQAILYRYEKQVKNRIDNERLKALQPRFNSANSADDWTELGKDYDKIQNCPKADEKKNACNKMVKFFSEIDTLKNRKSALLKADKQIKRQTFTLKSMGATVLFAILLFALGAITIIAGPFAYPYIYDAVIEYSQVSIPDVFFDLMQIGIILIGAHFIAEGLFVLFPGNSPKARSYRKEIEGYVNSIDNEIERFNIDIKNRNINGAGLNKNEAYMKFDLNKEFKMKPLGNSLINIPRRLLFLVSTLFFSIPILCAIISQSGEGNEFMIFEMIASVVIYIAMAVVVLFFNKYVPHTAVILFLLCLVPMLYPFIAVGICFCIQMIGPIIFTFLIIIAVVVILLVL